MLLLYTYILHNHNKNSKIVSISQHASQNSNKIPKKQKSGSASLSSLCAGLVVQLTIRMGDEQKALKSAHYEKLIDCRDTHKSSKISNGFPAIFDGCSRRGVHCTGKSHSVRPLGMLRLNRFSDEHQLNY